MKGSKRGVVALLAFMTNGTSLAGVGHGSAGGVARSIEANHNMAHNIQTAKSLGLMAGNPPAKRAGDFFGPFQVDCAVLRMCEVLA